MLEQHLLLNPPFHYGGYYYSLVQSYALWSNLFFISSCALNVVSSNPTQHVSYIVKQAEFQKDKKSLNYGYLHYLL